MKQFRIGDRFVLKDNIYENDLQNFGLLSHYDLLKSGNLKVKTYNTFYIGFNVPNDRFLWQIPKVYVKKCGSVGHPRTKIFLNIPV